MRENVMAHCRYFYGVLPVLRCRAFVVGILLLSCATGGHAQQRAPSQAPGSAIPTLEALPHTPPPPGEFFGWCGLKGKILMGVVGARHGTEIYDGATKASSLTFSSQSQLQCDEAGEKLALIDNDAGNVSEIDIRGSIVTRTLATFDKEITQTISFSPDFKNIASREALTLTSGAVNLNVVPLSGSGRRAIGRVHWHPDSSKLFGVSAPEGKGNYGIVEVLNTQRQRIGAGALPAGFLFRDGWFADSQSLYLYLISARDEFGSGIVVRCRIEKWKCDRIASDVIGASAGGDGILGMVRAIGKYSNNGEVETFPPGYFVEIRNGASQVVARQTFKSSDRYGFYLAVAPSGKKAILTWAENSICPAEKRDGDECRKRIEGGIMIDLSGRLK